MSFEADQALLPELTSGERLLWTGVPRQGIRFRPADLFMVPFSLMWGGFAVFWESSVIRSGAPLLFRLWGIPFVVLGLYLTVGRFFVDSYQRSRTYYGLTGQRVLIVSGLMSRQVKSLALPSLSDITLSERSDGAGTITFGPTNAAQAMWAGTSWPGGRRQMSPAFDTIDNARQVYDQVRRQQQAIASGES
jgi:hypothetical protein